VRAYRFALRPGWVALHVITVALIVTMILLGRWQLTVSEHKHFSLLNFGYALQWWLFSGFVAAMWWRIMRDQVRRTRAGSASGSDLAPDSASPDFRSQESTSAQSTSIADETQPTPPQADRQSPAPVAYRRYVMPTTDTSAVDDPVYAAYNDYLARLNAAEQR